MRYWSDGDRWDGYHCSRILPCLCNLFSNCMRNSFIYLRLKKSSSLLTFFQFSLPDPFGTLFDEICRKIFDLQWNFMLNDSFQDQFMHEIFIYTNVNYPNECYDSEANGHDNSILVKVHFPMYVFLNFLNEKLVSAISFTYLLQQHFFVDLTGLYDTTTVYKMSLL